MKKKRDREQDRSAERQRKRRCSTTVKEGVLKNKRGRGAGKQKNDRSEREVGAERDWDAE